MKHLSTVFSAILLTCTCAVAKDQFTTVQPSPIELVSVGEQHGVVAIFSGNLVISGKYVIGWKMLDDESYELEALFSPDPAAQERLPHELGKSEVTQLLLRPAEKAAELLTSAEDFKRLTSKELKTVHGESELEINNYSSGIDCDHRWYMADIVKVSITEVASISLIEEYPYGC